MEVKTSITRRWIGFFLLFFVLWYPTSVLLITAYELTFHPALFIGINVFTPLLALGVSYLYFRKARNDWTARFVTAFGWMLLMFVFAVALVRPVYGYAWTSIVNWDVVNANWINVVAIIVGALAAKKTVSTDDKISQG